MVYMGSKRRIAKFILPIILKDRRDGQYYVEPFCGGCNSLRLVDGNRIGSDNNKYLIALFQHLQDGGTLPLSIIKDEYYAVKANKDKYPEWYVGHVGFNCSSMGKWFESYISDGWVGKTGVRNYQYEHINGLLNQMSDLEDVCFLNKSYSDLTLPADSIIYCDPPYEGQRGYRQSFDHPVFWQWCRDMHAKGHQVFISEYNAPDDFQCVWQMDVKDYLSAKTTHIKTEKLFTL